MIAHYLTAIETLIQLETEPKRIEDSIAKLNTLVIEILKTDQQDGPLLAGLYDALARAIDSLANSRGSDDLRIYATNFRLRAKNQIDRSISSFCFFDMNEIKERISQHTKIPDLPFL